METIITSVDGSLSVTGFAKFGCIIEGESDATSYSIKIILHFSFLKYTFKDITVTSIRESDTSEAINSSSFRSSAISVDESRA